MTITVATLTNNDAPGPATATDEVGQTPLTITAVSKPTATTGSVAIVAGNIVYTPFANFNGSEVFNYTVQDTAGGTSTGTVTVTVNAVNDAPVANTDSAVAFKGVALQIPVADLLLNDTDGDTDVLQSLSIVAVSNPVNGTVSLNTATGLITFTPTAGYSGPASFQYTLQDSGATGGLNVNSATGTVNINVRDFVPTDITGKVWVDETGDGVINSKERTLGGVHIVLTGNAVGIPIQPRTYITLADGSYRFEDLAPGEYVVTYKAPSYMEDGVDVAGTLGDGDSVANQFTISIPQPGGAIATDYNFAAAGISPSYGRAMDLLASRFLNQNPSQNASQLFNGLIAAIGADNSQLWLAKFDGFDGMIAGEIVLNAAGNRAQVTMVDGQENVYTTSLTPTQFGVTTDRATGNKIVRVFGDIAAMNFQKINLAAPPVVSINRYLDAIDEVFAQEGWDGI